MLRRILLIFLLVPSFYLFAYLPSSRDTCVIRINIHIRLRQRITRFGRTRVFMHTKCNVRMQTQRRSFECNYFIRFTVAQNLLATCGAWPLSSVATFTFGTLQTVSSLFLVVRSLNSFQSRRIGWQRLPCLSIFFLSFTHTYMCVCVVVVDAAYKKYFRTVTYLVY